MLCMDHTIVESRDGERPIKAWPAVRAEFYWCKRFRARRDAFTLLPLTYVGEM